MYMGLESRTLLADVLLCHKSARTEGKFMANICQPCVVDVVVVTVVVYVYTVSSSMCNSYHSSRVQLCVQALN